MPRKATNVSSDIRKKSKAKGNKCNKEDKKLVKNIYIGASNAARWNILKNKLKYESDVELVQYLLNLAEPVLNRNDEDASVQGTVECEITSHEKPTSPEPEPELAKIQAIEIEQPAADQTHENLDTPTSNKVMKKFKHVQVEQAQNIQKSPNEHEETKVDSEINPKRKEDKKIKVKSNDQNEELSANADSNESGEVLPSEEDARDADWCPEGDAPLRRSPRKPGPRRSTRNHRHHRKRRHRRPSSPALQPPLREENHKHHHEKHKGCGSRGRKKRKHKDKQESGVVEEKSHVEEVVPSPAPPEPPTIEPSTLPSPSLSPIPTEPRHRRKHKRRDSKKRIHDIRRAPADGIPALEPPVSPVGATSVIQENVSSMTLPPPILELPPEPTVVSEITSCENDELHMTQAPCLSPAPTTPQLLQRVAIRIKLCGDCGCRHVQDACPLLTPIMQVPDALTRSQWISNPRKGSNFTQESLPIDLFALEERDSSHGLSVIVCSPIERYTQFGPLLGARIKQMDIPDDFHMRDIWEIKGLGERYYLSTTDFEQANWLRFIRPAPTKEQRNVAAVTRSNELYFVTLCALEPGAELLYWHEHSASGWARKKMEKTNCGGCNLRFGHSLYYRLHCSVFHDPSFSLTIRKYHCKVCGLAVLGKENIMRHAAEQHNGKGAYQCQFCKKFFLRLNYLEMHRTYGCAANPQRTRPLCDFCGRKFCQPQKLKVHIKRMHSDMAEVLREFQCKMCLKLLGSRAALQRHLKEVHHKDLVGACTCDRCGKMFQNKSNLKIHMLTHSGVKPFRCTEGSCNAAFTTKQCLQFHYKKVHGFTEESMPKIERCVAYTFDAYAGSNDNTSTSNNPSNPSPPFTPAGTEEASPAPSLPSLEDDDEEMSSCSPQPQRDIADHVDTSASSEHMPVCSPTPPPPILRAVSPVELPTICTRPTTILSKASKKWMGDVEITQPTMQPSKKWINELEPSPAPTMQEISKQRWSNEPPLQEPALDVATKRWVECSQPESPEHVDKKWALECNLPTMRSPDLRRPELSFTRTLVRPQVLDQDLMTEQTRGCSPLGGDFSPLRRTEPSASLLVEAALDAAERDLTGKLADLKPPTYMQQPRLNGNDVSEADYMSVACAKPSRLGVQTETGLDMSYKQYDTSELVNTELSNTEFRVMRSPEQVCSFEQEQGLDMSRTSSYANSAGYSRYSHSELQIPPHLHAHHRAAVAAAGLMYEMEPVRSPPPVSPPAYQTELLRHHWHHSHHTLDLSTARGQQSPEQSMSPPPQSYQNYPPSPYHAPPPRAPTPPYHHYSGYY